MGTCYTHILLIDVYHKTYDRLLFPLIFLNGTGSFGKSDEKEKFLKQKFIVEEEIINEEEEDPSPF